jgi:MoxR-like ATPase
LLQVQQLVLVQLQQVQQLLQAQDLAAMQEVVAATHVHPDVVRYIVALIHATRNSENILRGASPRATLAVTSMAKAVACLRGRDYVIPQDVQEVFQHTVAHRLLLTAKAESMGVTAQQVLTQVLEKVPVPKLR